MAKPSQNEIENMIQYARPTNRDLVRRDINQAINALRSNLLLKTASYYYSNGSSRELICLHGTVACEYRNTRYNIPIEVWLQEDHPKVPPLVSVKPTPNMYISPSSNDVQPNGNVVIPYLRNWRHPQSDLTTLLTAMSEAFSRTPPVYASSNNNPPPSQPQYSPYPPSSHPSYSPYPPQNPSRYPPYPPQNPPRYPSYPPSSQPPYPGYPTPYPVNPSSMPMPNVANPSYQYPHSFPQQQSGSQNDNRDSIQSAVLDKIRRQLEDTVQLGNGKIESLKQNEQELIDGEKTIKTLISSAQQEQIQAQNKIATLRMKIAEASEAAKETPQNDKESLVKEDALITPAPVYKQLLQAFAEEHAIQDLLYFLADGLRRESIGLDTYLKHVRELSRKQFILRATMYRCRQVAGLPIK